MTIGEDNVLFEACNCIGDAAALCAGRAGFVSAMMAALEAGSRTAPALHSVSIFRAEDCRFGLDFLTRILPDQVYEIVREKLARATKAVSQVSV